MIAVMYGAQGSSHAVRYLPTWAASQSSDVALVSLASKVTANIAAFASKASDGRGAHMASDVGDRSALDASRVVAR